MCNAKYTGGERFEIESIPEIDVRRVWPKEDRNFTPWLASPKGLELLGNALDLDIANPDMEKKGDNSNRRCDIVADVQREGGEEREGDEPAKMIIENQLEKTDFSHLGRLLLYAATHSARYVVWVVREVTDDHRRTIAWLNKNTTTTIGFYLVKVSTFQTGERRCAPFLQVVEEPDEEVKVEQSGSLNDRGKWSFWAGFSDFVSEDDNRGRLSFIGQFRPGSRASWYDVSIGTSSCHIALLCSNGNADIEIVIKTQEAFEKLHAIEADIDRASGVAADKTKKKYGNSRPVFRYSGPAVDIDDAASSKAAYRWYADKLAALVPIVQKALGVAR